MRFRHGIKSGTRVMAGGIGTGSRTRVELIASLAILLVVALLPAFVAKEERIFEKHNIDATMTSFPAAQGHKQEQHGQETPTVRSSVPGISTL